MKRLILTMPEFLNFRAICERLRIKFDYQILKGQAIVQAEAARMEEIGF